MTMNRVPGAADMSFQRSSVASIASESLNRLNESTLQKRTAPGCEEAAECGESVPGT